LRVTIPANTTATIYVPAQAAETTIASTGATRLRLENGGTVYETGSGSYTFKSKL
jgi:hypothetical protein